MKYFVVRVPDDKEQVVLIQHDRYPWFEVVEYAEADLEYNPFEEESHD